MISLLVIELLCLGFSSFFSGMETGLLSADKLKIYSKKQEGRYWARTVDFLISKPERLLGTVLIGNNIANITSAIVLTNYLRQTYSIAAAAAGSLVLTVLLLLFGEILPKTFFRRYADTVTVRLSVILRVFYYLFLPFSFLFNAVVTVLMFFFGQKGSGDKMPRSRDDFRQLMHLSSREAGFGYDDYRTIDDILDFAETLAIEAMIPIHKYPVFHVNTKAMEIIRASGQTGQRYFPVYAKRTDNIVGYIDTQDFALPGKESAADILKPPAFYPEVKPLPDLLDAMVENGLDVVFLTDEFGAISGLMTHQEIASEIIGAIPGNVHTEKEPIIRLDDGAFIASGDTDLEHFAHATDIKLTKNNNETLGGYLCEKMGVIPPVGTEYQEGPVLFTVLDGDQRVIGRVRIQTNEEKES
ncbi:MAG: HlyC/CorC family transporter [Spirochaetales bacterium]|nr:HlyC/CorC family transporter [Spirochaetales bacterium]